MNPRILAASLALLTLPRPAAESPEYLSREIRGWTVRIHSELLGQQSALGRDVLELLDHKLFDITRVVPEKALAQLEQVTIWIDLDDERVPGGVYHPSHEWLVEHDYNPDLAHCVQFGTARNFLKWSFDQPWMVLHELAHAYHHQVLDYSDPRVAQAFAQASESGKYAQVLRCNGSEETAYAMNNAQEYFAELSEAYFGVNDFYPFVRAEVREFDPVGYAMLEDVWGK